MAPSRSAARAVRRLLKKTDFAAAMRTGDQ